MKRIAKGAEPSRLSAWKAKHPGPYQKENWDEFRKDRSGKKVYKELRSSLEREQGGICCYCNPAFREFLSHPAARSPFAVRLLPKSATQFLPKSWNQEINLDDCHVDHLRPRSFDLQRMFDYDNMLLSCQRHGKKTEPPHCGVKKDNWFDEALLIHPLRADCAAAFEFGAAGNIATTRDAPAPLQRAATTTIQKLGLDIKKLERARRAAIDEWLDPDMDRAQLQRLLMKLESRDANGRYVPFCAAITSLAKRYLAPAAR